MSANADWLQRSRAAVWHPCTQMKVHETLPLVPLARGEGAWLYDFDGRRYLDAVSSWWVNLFGHAHPRINAAIADQLGRLPHAMLAGFTHAPVVELSERLHALAPGGLSHAFYASDGASAIEIALKMSFHHWRNRGLADKRGFIALSGGYHGETLGALGVTDVPLFRDAYAPLLRRNATVPCPDARQARARRPAAQLAADAAAALEVQLARHHATTAALIVEPLVQGAAGMVMYDPAYLVQARALCTRYGVHLIADEIMTGFGRTGTLFAWEQVIDAAGAAAGGAVAGAAVAGAAVAGAAVAGAAVAGGAVAGGGRDVASLAPDFLCLSKGITGGTLPLSCVLTSDEVYAAFYADEISRAFLHSHSYTGNPLACRAALAVLDLFAEEDVIAVNRAKAARWRTLAQPLAAHSKVRHWRQRGMIVAFDVQTARADFARWCFCAGLQRELLLRPIGNTVYFMPPYVVDDATFCLLVERTLEIVDDA